MPSRWLSSASTRPGSATGACPTPTSPPDEHRGGRGKRLHIDLRPGDQAAEVARLEGLGARRVDVGQGEVTWVVLADPDGNEFCVLRALAPQDAAYEGV